MPNVYSRENPEGAPNRDQVRRWLRVLALVALSLASAFALWTLAMVTDADAEAKIRGLIRLNVYASAYGHTRGTDPRIYLGLYLDLLPGLVFVGARRWVERRRRVVVTSE